MLIYLLKVNLAISVLYGIYWLFFRGDTFFRWKRCVLLCICFFPFIFPLLSFPAETVSNPFREIQYVQLPEIIVEPENYLSSEFSVLKYLLLIYWEGIVFLLFKKTIGIIQVVCKIKKSRKIILAGIPVYLLQEEIRPFSFFNRIVLNSKICQEDHQTLKVILNHEKAHVVQYHSWDVIINDLVCVCCWFNPLVWLLKKEIKMNLEFLADRAAIDSGCDPKYYQLCLLYSSSQKAIAPIINNFNVSPLKKRILMINKVYSKKNRLFKYLMFIPLVAGLLLANNAANGTPNDVIEIYKVSNEETDLQDSQQRKVDGPVEKHCDVMPEYPGGEPALFEFLATAIQYPESAQKKELQGRVAVRFVVNKKGEICDPEILRSLDPECDTEAVRVILSMPKWSPGMREGKAVNVYYVIPITFKLN